MVNRDERVENYIQCWKRKVTKIGFYISKSFYSFNKRYSELAENEKRVKEKVEKDEQGWGYTRRSEYWSFGSAECWPDHRGYPELRIGRWGDRAIWFWASVVVVWLSFVRREREDVAPSWLREDVRRFPGWQESCEFEASVRWESAMRRRWSHAIRESIKELIVFTLLQVN